MSTYNDSADEINLVIEAVEGEEAPTYIDFTIQGEETSIAIPAGKTAQTYPRMAGDYTFTWTGDAKIYVDNNVIANGATVSLWNSFIQIVPNDSSVDCTVVLTVEEYVAPADLPLGSTEVKPGSMGFIVKEFSGAAGTYTISCSEGGVINGIDAGGYPDYEEITTFTLANDGDVFEFAVCLTGWEIDTVTVTITKEAAVEPDPTPVEAVLGTNAVAVPADKCVKATFTAAEEGTYRITLADGETNAIIKVNGEEITCPAQYELAANESVTFEVWSKLDTDDTIDFVISKYTGTDDPSTDSDEGNWTQNY